MFNVETREQDFREAEPLNNTVERARAKIESETAKEVPFGAQGYFFMPWSETT